MTLGAIFLHTGKKTAYNLKITGHILMQFYMLMYLGSLSRVTYMTLRAKTDGNLQVCASLGHSLIINFYYYAFFRQVVVHCIMILHALPNVASVMAVL